MARRAFFALVPASLMLLCGLGVLYLSNLLQLNALLCTEFAILTVTPFFVQAIALRLKRDMDLALFPFAVALSFLGILLVARLKPSLLLAQMHWAFLGMVTFLLVLGFRRRVLRLLDYPYLVGLCCLLLLCSTLFFGTEIGGSKNWIVLGPIAVQPSEFGKALLVFFLAAYLSMHRETLTLARHHLLWLRLPDLRFIAPLLLIWGVAILMFVVARDLGSALLFFGIAIFMTYMATGRLSYVFLALVFFSGAGALSASLFPHVHARFAIWLHPWTDPDGQAFQIVQSLFAFAAGGIWGEGFGHGLPTLIPEVHTDFVFAAIGDELGLLGALGVMLLYALFFHRAMRVALQAQEDRQILLAAGTAVVFLLQAFIIIAGVTKFLPLTGITLPFVSYGGSSMVSGFLLLGVLVALSKKENRHG